MTVGKLTNFVVVTTMVFSLWVAFALLVVNPYLHPYVPGYQVGRPCGWEFIAGAASAAIAWLWTRNWTDPVRITEDGISYIKVSYSFVVFLLCYLVAAAIIFVWQYAKFSAGFE